METSDQLRHRIINRLPLLRTENIPDGAVFIWEQLATHIIAIVGEDGFNSLYMRSLDLTRSKFPWLDFDPHSIQTGQRFAELKMRLERQAPEHASEANLLLLSNFTGILASLIGEQLTTSILRLAWGIEVGDSPGKEKK